MKLSQRMCWPRDSGIATWIKCPDHAKELTPNKPDKWWFNLDSTFLNHETVGLYFGCKCNHPANNAVEANKSKNIEPLNRSKFD